MAINFVMYVQNVKEKTEEISIVLANYLVNYAALFMQAQLAKLPKNLLAKTDMIRNTGQVCYHYLQEPCKSQQQCFLFLIPTLIMQVLQQLPLVVSSLDAYMDDGLQWYSAYI